MNKTEAIVVTLGLLEDEWTRLDNKRGRTLYPQDQPILADQQRIEAVITEVKDLKAICEQEGW